MRISIIHEDRFRASNDCFLGNLGVERLKIYHRFPFGQHIGNIVTAQHDRIVPVDYFRERTAANWAFLSLGDFGK